VFVWMVVLSVVAFWFTWQLRRKETIEAL